MIESDKNNSQNCVLSCSSIPFLEQPQWHPKWHPKAIRIESLHYPKGIRKVSEMVSNHIILTPAAATAKTQHYPKSIRNGSEMTPSPSQKHAKRRDGKIMWLILWRFLKTGMDTTVPCEGSLIVKVRSCRTQTHADVKLKTSLRTSCRWKLNLEFVKGKAPLSSKLLGMNENSWAALAASLEMHGSGGNFHEQYQM